MNEYIQKKIYVAEKRILELIKSGDLKKLENKYEIYAFYLDKSKNRLDTAKLIYDASNKSSGDYSDYAEVVAAAYYSMYYMVHAFLASKYKTKLRHGLRGVHVITEYLVLYYLVKTQKLAQHLYDEYIRTLETTSHIQKLTLDDFYEKAYEFAKKYDKSRSARESFTYTVTKSIEEYTAKHAIETAEEFINTIRQLTLSK